MLIFDHSRPVSCQKRKKVDWNTFCCWCPTTHMRWCSPTTSCGGVRPATCAGVQPPTCAGVHPPHHVVVSDQPHALVQSTWALGGSNKSSIIRRHGCSRLRRIVTELRIAVRSRIANFYGFRFAVRCTSLNCRQSAKS